MSKKYLVFVFLKPVGLRQFSDISPTLGGRWLRQSSGGLVLMLGSSLVLSLCLMVMIHGIHYYSFDGLVLRAFRPLVGVGFKNHKIYKKSCKSSSALLTVRRPSGVLERGGVPAFFPLFLFPFCLIFLPLYNGAETVVQSIMVADGVPWY